MELNNNFNFSDFFHSNDSNEDKEEHFFIKKSSSVFSLNSADNTTNANFLTPSIFQDDYILEEDAEKLDGILGFGMDDYKENNEKCQNYMGIYDKTLFEPNEKLVEDEEDLKDLISSIQTTVEKMYYNEDFDLIIQYIEAKFPNIFTYEKNKTHKISSFLLYMVTKLKFYKHLKNKQLVEAKFIYDNYLFKLIKEIKPNSWKSKVRFFEKLLSNDKNYSLLVKKNYLKKFYNDLASGVEEVLRTYFGYGTSSDDSPNTNSGSLKDSSSNLQLNFYNNDEEESLSFFHKINVNSNEEHLSESNQINNEDLLSTNVEYSDYEEDLYEKEELNNENDGENKESNDNEIHEYNFSDNFNSVCTENDGNFNFNFIGQDPAFPSQPVFLNGKAISKPSVKSNKHCVLSEVNENEINTSVKNKNNLFVINTSVNCSQNQKETKMFDVENFIMKGNKVSENGSEGKRKGKKKKGKEEIIFNQLPYLSSFKPKYTKRETLDKRILRAFTHYVNYEYKNNKLNVSEEVLHSNFFVLLVTGCVPPLEYYDSDLKEALVFNSCNSNFLIWFFSKLGVKDLYNSFVSQHGKVFIDNLKDYYSLTEEESNQLFTYFSNLPNIFDISLFNNITKGKKVRHIYRRVNRNRRKESSDEEKDKEERRERSRERNSSGFF